MQVHMKLQSAVTGVEKQMFKTLCKKVNNFAALHPRMVMYGISIGATLGIALTLSFAVSPHNALADKQPEPGCAC